MNSANPKRLILVSIILIAAFVELGFLTFWKNKCGAFTSPIIFLFSGIIVGVGFLFLAKNQSLTLKKQSFNTRWRLIDFVILSLGIYFCWELLVISLGKFPASMFFEGKGSDVIPQIRVMVRRFLSGDYPYQMITGADWSYGFKLFPTYLPMTWTPFILAEWTNLDYRIYAFGILMVSILIYYHQFVSNTTNIFIRIVAISIPFAYFYIFLYWNMTLSLVIEPLIVGFYLFLATSIFAKRSIWLIIALILCLLSRYSIVLFTPLILVVIGYKKNWFQAIKMSIGIGAAILLIYLIPFLSKDPTIFTKGYNYHTKAALSAWKKNEDAGILSNKSFFSKGLGMSVFAAQYIDAPVEKKLKLYQRVHLILSVLTVFVLGLFFFKCHNYYDYRIFLLGGMKIYLVIFYNFIQYPFPYLYLVPIFISVPILYFTMNFLNAPKRESL